MKIKPIGPTRTIAEFRVAPRPSPMAGSQYSGVPPRINSAFRYRLVSATTYQRSIFWEVRKRLSLVPQKNQVPTGGMSAEGYWARPGLRTSSLFLYPRNDQCVSETLPVVLKPGLFFALKPEALRIAQYIF